MRIVLCSLALILAGLAMPWASAADRPLRQVTTEDERFMLRIHVGRPGQSLSRVCRATLYENASRGRRTHKRWDHALVNDVAPVKAVIHPEARYLVTLDEYRRGGARHPVVIYDDKGQLLRHFLLTDLLTPSDWEHVRVREKSIEWLDGATFEFTPTPPRFVIRLKWGRQICIDLRTLELVPDADEADAYVTLDGLPPEIMLQLFGEIIERSSKQTDAADVEAAADPPADSETDPGPEMASEAGETESAERLAATPEDPAAGDEAVPPDTDLGAAPDPMESPEPDVPLDVPAPDPANPFDYLAWLNEQAITDGPSAVPDYEAAIGQLTPWEGDRELRDAALRGDPTALATEEVQQWLAQNAEALDHFRNATHLEFRGWHLESEDGSMIGALLPALAPLRELSRASIVQGQQLLNDGQVTEAAEHYLDVLAAGAHAANSNTIIESLLGQAIQAVGANAVLQLVERSGDALDYVSLKDELEQAYQSPRPLAETLQFERAMFMDTMQRVYSVDPDTGEYALNIDYAARTLSMVGFDEASLDETTAAWLVNEADFEDTIAEGNAYYDAVTEAVNLPYSQARQTLNDLEHSAIEARGVNPLVRSLLPAFTRLHFNTTRSTTLERGTKLVARLKAYQQEFGHLPDTLSPAEFGEVAIDPFTGAPFQYRRLDDGFELYSLGDNGLDDGGQHDNRAETGDFVIWPPRR